MRVHFRDHEFQRAFVAALAATYHQAADAGEVLVTAGRIVDGDPDSWLHEWTASAGAVWTAAVRARSERRHDTALAYFRRAATYYATALSQALRSSEPERRSAIWRRQRACWDAIVQLTRPRVEQLAIPYEGKSLPGFLFPAPGAGGQARPLVIVNSGYCQTTSSAWVQAGAAAAQRGYHWLTFDGPGQEAALVDLKLSFRPDWEIVLTAVLDSVVTRDDVQPDRIAVIGIAEGSYLVARALAFERRFAAAVLNPGVTDVSSRWTALLSPVMRAHLQNGRAPEFDREMQLRQLLSHEAPAPRGEPYGHAGGSPYELYRALTGYRLGEEVRRITTPVLIVESEAQRLWPGQSRALYASLDGSKWLVDAGDSERVRGLGDALVPAVRESLVFDWLDDHLGRQSHIDMADPRSQGPQYRHSPQLQ